MDLLIRTPHPYRNESIWGYVLRISEANGYRTPSRMLSVSRAGGKRGMNANVSPEVISRLVGCDKSALRRIANYREGSSEVFVLGQLISNRANTNPLRLKKPALCPYCVKENGHIDAIWDIALMVACPRHGCETIDSCHVCGEPLQYQRPKLLKCPCGANLDEAPIKAASLELIEFVSVIAAKVHGSSVLGLQNTSGLPLEHFEPMSPLAFFDMLDGVARHALMSRRGIAQKSDLEVASKTVEVFRNWPHGYHDFLRSIDNIYGSRNSNSVRLFARFREFFTSMFVKRPNAKEFIFLRDEFVRYGCDGLGNCTVSKQAAKELGLQRKLISQAELCRLWNVTPPTLKRILHDHDIPVRIVGQRHKPNYIIDISAYDVSMLAEPKTADRKAAAEMIGMPERILAALRKRGIYHVANPANKRGDYLIADIERFRKSLLDVAPVNCPERSPAEMTASFRDVLFTFKFGSDDEKCDFVSKYLFGEIKPIGRYGDSTAEILFNRQMVLDLTRMARIFQKGREFTAKDAAEFLVTDERIVPMLVRSGVLGTVVDRNGILRVKKESVQEFSMRWCSIKSVATDFRISARRVQRLADENEIPRFVVDATSSLYQSSFVERKYEIRLREIVDADVGAFERKG